MKPHISDVRVTKGAARYKIPRFLRIKTWLLSFTKRVPFPTGIK